MMTLEVNKIQTLLHPNKQITKQTDQIKLIYLFSNLPILLYFFREGGRGDSDQSTEPPNEMINQLINRDKRHETKYTPWQPCG